MKPEFQIDVDVARNLVRTRLAGLFDDATVHAFLAARREAFLRLRCGPSQPLSVIDVRDMAIQTQEIVARWTAALGDPAYRSRRLAFIVASTLVRAQLLRAIGSRDARCYTDPAEAERWVLHGDVAQAA